MTMPTARAESGKGGARRPFTRTSAFSHQTPIPLDRAGFIQTWIYPSVELHIFNQKKLQIELFDQPMSDLHIW